MTLRTALTRWHRWAGLAVAAFWFVQALTGVLIVFHWEIEDAMIAGAHRATDFDAIERRVAELAPPGSGISIGSIWTTAGTPDRYDVDVQAEAPGISRSVRIDGAGDVLRDTAADGATAKGGWVGTLVTIHHNLLGGDAGSWIVGISGILLITNIGTGLAIAWPKRRQWRRSLFPARAGPPVARHHGWHRALGLWVGIPALAMVGAGVLLTFENSVDAAVAPPAVEAPADSPAGPAAIGLASAARTALSAFPGAALAAIYPPDGDRPVWHIRVTQPDEARRAYGATHVFVSAVDGRVLARFDALRAPPRRAFMDGLFPFHTGEMGGFAGRFAVAAIGMWLMTMIGVGLALWMTRRRTRRGKR